MYVSIKELKDHLSNYVHRVQQGEELVVTLHKKNVAKLIPFVPSETNTQLKHKKLLIDLKKLHEKIGHIVLKESMRETVIKMRKQERY